jgi:WD40 repeat protein
MLDTRILSVSFNSTYSCLLCCNTDGFTVYTLNPFRCIVQRLLEGGIRLGQMYRETNLFFLCGTGNSMKYPTNRVIVWDDNKKRTTSEISLNRRVEYINVSSYGTLIIMSKQSAYLYNTETMELQHQYECSPNCITTSILSDGFVMAHANNAMLTHTGVSNSLPYGVSVRTESKYISIPVHQSPIRKIAIDHVGKYICSCSDAGTRLNVIDIGTGNSYENFRRGNFSTRITFLGFSDQNQWIICGTETGTLHGFRLHEAIPKYDSLWGLMHRRSNFNLKLHEPIILAILLEERGVIYIVTQTKLYEANLKGDDVTLGKSVLLLHPKDPFTPSPKCRCSPRMIPTRPPARPRSKTVDCVHSI